MRNTAIFSEYWRTEWVILTVTLFLVTYLYIRFRYTFWKRKGVYSVPGSFPFGSIGDFLLFKKNPGEVFADIYNKGKGCKYVGYYSFISPALLVRDLELIKNILVKDFDSFSHRGMYHDENVDSLSCILFALDGPQWRYMRTKVTPTLSSGKLKFMYGTMKDCVNQFLDYLQHNKNSDNVYDFKDLIAKEGVNVIAKVAVGIEGHNFYKESEFSKITLKTTEPYFMQSLRFTLPMISKNVAKMVKLRFTPKQVEKYFLEITEKIMNQRKEPNSMRNDFMQLLIDIKSDEKQNGKTPSLDGNEHSESKLTVKEIAAQIFNFILAGYETSAVSLCYALYEIAMHQDIQEKILSEIEPIEDDISYESLNKLNYMDTVLEEVWRKYPPAPILFRECGKEYVLPDGAVIPAKTTILIPVLGLQHDPEFFPDPEKFNPERFNKESPSQVVQPFTFLPFGDGPRACIGSRFARMHIKLILFKLIRNFSLEASDKTIIPPVLEPKTFMINPAGGMWLRLIPRKKEDE